MSDDRCDLLCLDLPTAERLRQRRLAAGTAEAAAARAQGLADPKRLHTCRGAARCRRALRLRPRLDRRAFPEPRLASREGVPGERARSLASRREDGDVRPDRGRARARGVRPGDSGCACLTRAPVSSNSRDPAFGRAGQARASCPGAGLGGIAWHVVEFAIAIGAGIAAGSIALIGFGADSLIEAFAGLVVSGCSPAPVAARAPRSVEPRS